MSRVDNIAWGRASELVDELAPHTSSAGAIEVASRELHKSSWYSLLAHTRSQ